MEKFDKFLRWLCENGRLWMAKLILRIFKSRGAYYSAIRNMNPETPRKEMLEALDDIKEMASIMEGLK